MNSPSCSVTAPTQKLIAYWLGELDTAVEAEVEEHLFGCAECSERLHALTKLAEGIRHMTREGRIRAILSAPFVMQLQALGLRIREYRLSPGSSVMCTVAPEDDLVLAHLHAPLHDVQRLDLLIHDSAEDVRLRIEDVAFDPKLGEIVMLPHVEPLRHVATTQHVKLLAVEPSGERVIGEYTFNHSRYSEPRRN